MQHHETILEETPFESLIKSLVSVQPFSSQRRKYVEQFLRALMGWVLYHDKIFQNQELVSQFDYKYPYYRLNRRNGYYPIPSSLLRTWNRRYNTILSWLIDIGFLEAAPYKYCPGKSICKYYLVHKDWETDASVLIKNCDRLSRRNVKSLASELVTVVSSH